MHYLLLSGLLSSPPNLHCSCLLLFPFSHTCGLHIKYGRAAHLFQNVSHCNGSIVELQDCKVGSYLHRPCTTKFFPSWAKPPHQTLVWLVGILCRATETSLQQLLLGWCTYVGSVDCINNVIRQEIMVSIGVFNISFHFLALTPRFSTFLWYGLLSVEFQ